MLKAASSRGIELCQIDFTKPLVGQGRFDAIVHKLRPDAEWEKNLQDYLKEYPDVKIIDSLKGIRTLQNRGTMLFPLEGEGVSVQEPNDWDGPCASARVQAPKQVQIAEGTSLSEAEALLADAGLKPPLLVKPLWTDGREGSHGLAVLHDLTVLGKLLQGGVTTDLKPPLVVQQFVEHGGVMYKVYVLGTRTVVCRRPSLGDTHLGKEAQKKGVMSLPRISCKSIYAKDSPEYQFSSGTVEYSSHPDIPPEWVTQELASVLRTKLGIQLFNFDMICPEGQSPGECLYYVIDINYFPGVDKIPNFENVFVDFLETACLGDNNDSDGVPADPSNQTCCA